jgi:predicted dehydrogenase
MGKHHATAVHSTDGLTLVGVFDVLPDRREAAAEEQPGATVHSSYEALLSDPNVDLVILITPHDTHAPLAIQASRAGKHVVTEKVMCLDTAEADAMIGAARDAERVLTVYQNRRWDGDFLTVRKTIDSGVLGNVFSIESSVNGWWFPAGWRGVKASGGGMLYDWGAHLADQLVQMKLPALPQIVFALDWSGAHAVDIETQTTASIAFSDGTIASIDVGCASHRSRSRWLVRGEKAALEMRDWETAVVTGEVEGLRGEMKLEVEKSRWGDFYTNLSRHLNEGEALAVDPAEVRIGIQILEAARRSAETGESVHL